MDSESTMRAINPLSVAQLTEPYHTCSLEGGLSARGVFPVRSVQSFEMFVERLRPSVKAIRVHVSENFSYPVEHYHALTGDGLLTVCMRVHDDNKTRHKITTYDHVTQELKPLGYIPRHKFIDLNIDSGVVCMNDPPFTEGVIAALTPDCNFVVVLAHSTRLRIVNIFDIPNTTSLLQKDCTQIEFLNCCPCGVALNPSGLIHGDFKIAILNNEMEVRLWNATTLSQSAVKLECVHPGIALSRFGINPRESAIRFSPNGLLLCVLAYVPQDKHCACVILDNAKLEPLFLMPFGFMYAAQMCCIFPSFSVCGSKLAMFSSPVGANIVNSVVDMDNYKLLFFEMPVSIETLKKRCKSLILSLVHNSKLSELPLPNNLIAYLSDNSHIDTDSCCKIPLDNKDKGCDLM